MAKFTRGIPDGFDLDIKPLQDLGDYLDEPSPAAVAPSRKQPRSPAQAPPRQSLNPAPSSRIIADVPSVVRPARPVEPPPFATQPETWRPFTPEPEESVREREERGAARPKAPRREISMTPETLRMSDELLDMIRGGSGQRDTKASEVFHALVLLVHEVRDELDLHSIPKRGRWGSPTARAYPLELKNTFLQALLKKYASASLSPISLRYP